jgi:hypothetical protein
LSTSATTLDGTTQHFGWSVSDAPKSTKLQKNSRRFNYLVLSLHLPSIRHTFVCADLYLHGAKPIPELIRNYYVDHRCTGGRECSYQISSQELTHHIVLARSTNNSRITQGRHHKEPA